MTQYTPTSDPRLCPTCGQAIPLTFAIRVIGSFLLFEGHKWRLSPKEQAIMKELLAGMENGYNVTTDHLLTAMYEDNPPKSAMSAITVYINKLRRKFKGSGIRITNEYTIYRLSLD